MKALDEQLTKIFREDNILDESFITDFLINVNKVLSLENEFLRPRDNMNNSGGLIFLDKNIDTILVSDIHSRVEFLKNLIDFKVNGKTVLQLLSEKKIQIVCVGDLYHSEINCKNRWLCAMEEMLGGFKFHNSIDFEFNENIKTLHFISLLKINFPENFHFLKGNHENIANENINGNLPFGKFSKEGLIVKLFLEKFYSKELFKQLYIFEKKLPIVAVGNNFVVSHSEPRNFHSKEEIINYNQNPDVIFDFTWTGNNEATKNSVENILKHFFSSNYNYSRYFAGHRPVPDMYSLRANNFFVQFHNPLKQNIVIISPGEDISLDKNIVNLMETKGYRYG